MSQPSYNSDGTTPRRTDTQRTVWDKILAIYQNRGGADPANNNRKSDTLRQIKQKVLNATQ